MPPGALQAAESGATLRKDVKTVEWNGQVSESTFHLFVNNTAEPLDLSWGDEHYDSHHGVIAPGKNLFVGTYAFHSWRVRSATRGTVATYSGPSAVVTINPDGVVTQRNATAATPSTALAVASGAAPPADQAGGAGTSAAAAQAAGSSSEATAVAVAMGDCHDPDYKQRGAVLGMPIMAFDCVSDAAVSRLGSIVGAMLAHSPPAVVERLRAANASFAAFGRSQLVSDVPMHRFMRHTVDRNIDATARGLGATPALPVTSCGEENLTMEGDGLYCCQSILVHETGHAVLNLGLDGAQVEAVCAAYNAAMKDGLYPPGCYMASNEQEYWATGVESWFESTIREDVNGGVRTRERLRRHDPRLAALLQQAFGDGPWRYHQDCPKPLAMPSREAYFAHTDVLAKAAGSDSRRAQGAAGSPAAAGAAAASTSAGSGGPGKGPLADAQGAASMGRVSSSPGLNGGQAQWDGAGATHGSPPQGSALLAGGLRQLSVGSSWRERRPAQLSTGGEPAGTFAFEGRAPGSQPVPHPQLASTHGHAQPPPLPAFAAEHPPGQELTMPLPVLSVVPVPAPVLCVTAEAVSLGGPTPME